MTKFADQLLEHLMREHGPALTRAGSPVPRRPVTTRRALLAAGAGGVAVAATAGVLLAAGGTPAYAVTAHPNGTVTLAVYRAAGIAQANARLRQLGDSQVVVVPVRPGCPGMSSLPAPAVPAGGGHISMQASTGRGGSVTVRAQGIPAGDIIVVGSQTAVNGSSRTSVSAARLTSPPAPGCVSLPALPGGGS